MIKSVGGVDHRGDFLLRVTFDNQDPEDMDEMKRILRDPETDTTVENYDEDQVEVLVRSRSVLERL